VTVQKAKDMTELLVFWRKKKGEECRYFYVSPLFVPMCGVRKKSVIRQTVKVLELRRG
jgi:hypothetical protein